MWRKYTRAKTMRIGSSLSFVHANMQLHTTLVLIRLCVILFVVSLALIQIWFCLYFKQISFKPKHNGRIDPKRARFRLSTFWTVLHCLRSRVHTCDNDSGMFWLLSPLTFGAYIKVAKHGTTINVVFFFSFIAHRIAFDARIEFEVRPIDRVRISFSADIFSAHIGIAWLFCLYTIFAWIFVYNVPSNIHLNFFCLFRVRNVRVFCTSKNNNIRIARFFLLFVRLEFIKKVSLYTIAHANMPCVHRRNRNFG